MVGSFVRKFSFFLLYTYVQCLFFNIYMLWYKFSYNYTCIFSVHGPAEEQA